MNRRLVTHLIFASMLAVTLPAVASAAGTAANHHAGKSHHAAVKSAATPKIDINSASTSDLTALPGIDDATAQKIVDGRPWKNSSQLVAKNIVTKDQFTKIRSRVIARQEMKKADKSATKEAPKAAPQTTPGSSEGTTK